MMILGSRHFALCCLLLFCFLAGCVSAETVTVIAGSNATLKCSYDAKYYGRLSACWGRGAIPNSGCGNEVLKTDGTSVISRFSYRYLLMGSLSQGDVSLTIRDVEVSDSGVYGCRVEIPGWFNDHKQHVTLRVNAVPPKPLTIKASEVKERSITISWFRMFDGGRPIIGYTVDIKNKQTSWETKIRTELHNPLLTQVTLVDLRPSKTYNLRMFAANSMGMSETSNVLTVTTKEAAPEGPPLDMQLVALSSNSIKVTWKPPSAELRNGVLRGYNINYREYDPVSKQFKRWQYLSVMAISEQESIILRNLKPSTMYGVLIQAKTIAGVGPSSNAPLCSTLAEVHKTTTETDASSSTAVTMWIHDTSFSSVYPTSATSTTLSNSATSATSVTSASSTTFYAATVWEQSAASSSSVPPDPPAIELKKVDGNTFSLFWITRSEGDITGYILEYKAANASWDHTKTVDFGPHDTEATIIEMNPSTYNIRMFAKSSQATSAASNVLTITTGEAGHQKDIFLTTTPSTHDALTLLVTPFLSHQQGDNQVLTIRFVIIGHNLINAERYQDEILQRVAITYLHSLGLRHSNDKLYGTPFCQVIAEESHGRHLIGIIVSVGLVVLIGTIILTWQLHRVKQKKGTLSIWLAKGGVRHTDCESLHEL